MNKTELDLNYWYDVQNKNKQKIENLNFIYGKTCLRAY